MYYRRYSGISHGAVVQRESLPLRHFGLRESGFDHRPQSVVQYPLPGMASVAEEEVYPDRHELCGMGKRAGPVVSEMPSYHGRWRNVERVRMVSAPERSREIPPLSIFAGRSFLIGERLGDICTAPCDFVRSTIRLGCAWGGDRACWRVATERGVV